MLNKDQYNQDEYNNYYKQEIEGAEIKGYNDDEGGFMKKAILFLGLIALGFAGYFGFKTFNSSKEDSTTVTKEKIVIKEETSKSSEKPQENETTPKSKTVEEKVLKTIETNKVETTEATNNSEETTKEEIEARAKAVEEKIEKTIQQEVATQVQEKLEENKKMSTDDISKIVDLVMNKIEKDKVEAPKTDTDTNTDTDLLSALQNSDSDSVEIKTNDVNPIKTNVESTVQKDVEKLNSNNKVTLDSDSKSNNTENLTELSQQIKKLLNMAGASNQPTTNKSTSESTEASVTDGSTNTATNYEQSISKEIKVRTNEMRIIVVKSGDTLNKIAQRAYGSASSYQKIFDANPEIRRADRIYVGQKLRIPK